MISLKNVSKSFGPVKVLQGVNLEVVEGETVAVIGPSGGGKSTLLRSINLMTPPDSGSVEVAGTCLFRKVAGQATVALRPADLRLARQSIGMVFQQSNLFTHRTVLENVVEGPLQVLRSDRAAAEKQAHELLERLGLGGFGGRYPRELSGGQQQRVAICRALAMNPRVMLFDEPTSALDPELVGEVLLTVREIALTGMTVIIVTHEMSFARHVANRVAFMDGGRLIETSPSATFFTDPQTDRARQFLAAIRDPFGTHTVTEGV